MLKLLTLLLVAGFCCAKKASLEFPTTSSPKCILIDIDMMNSLTWTDSTGKKKSVPDWDFTNSSTISGSCGGGNRLLSQQFASDNAVYTFAFTDGDEKEVSLVMSLNFSPDNVFKNGKKASVILDTESMELSMDDKAYNCGRLQTMKASKNVSGDYYEMTVRVMSLHAQAFNVKDSTFSEDSHCDDDLTTEAPAEPTTQPPAEPTTQPPAEPTTQPPVEPTTQPPSNVTTEPPTNTTTEPVTTIKPTPAPTANHPAQSVSVMDAGMTCVMLKGQFLFTIPYDKKDGSKGTAMVGVQDVSNHTMGSCNSSTTNQVQINFLDKWWMNLTIMSNDKSEALGKPSDDTKYWWHSVNLTYVMDEKTFPMHNGSADAEESFSKTFENSQFQATVAGSYLCNADTKTDLGGGFQLETWDLQYFAFQSDNKTKFTDDNVQECSADAKTNSIVPIAVGAALAGLVVIVLIAYLIGRRRNRKGYESV